MTIEELDATEAKLRKLTRGMRHHHGCTDPETADAILARANRLLEGHGIESIRCGARGCWGYYGETRALYVNTGDTYSLSLVYDTARKRFYIWSWGDWAEWHSHRCRSCREGA